MTYQEVPHGERNVMLNFAGDLIATYGGILGSSLLFSHSNVQLGVATSVATGYAFLRTFKDARNVSRISYDKPKTRVPQREVVPTLRRVLWPPTYK